MRINACRWPGRGELTSAQTFARSRLPPLLLRKKPLPFTGWPVCSSTPRLEIQFRVRPPPPHAPSELLSLLIMQPIFVWKSVLLFGVFDSRRQRAYRTPGHCACSGKRSSRRLIRDVFEVSRVYCSSKALLLIYINFLCARKTCQIALEV